jgi:AbrB family looped-hinge helix DNA binding protein
MRSRIARDSERPYLTHGKEEAVAKIAVSKITSKGQVTIPEEIRREYHLQAGEQVEWEVTDRGTVELRKAGGSLDDLARILPRPAKTASVEDMDRGIATHLRRKHRARR